MAEVVVITEREEGAGWVFTLRVGRGAEDRLHTLALSWADHERWTHGTVSASRVAEAVARVALAEGGELPERLNAARLVREIGGFEEKLREALGGL